MPRLQRLSDPAHNVVHLVAATMGVTMLAFALIDLVDHWFTLGMVVH